MRVIPSSLPRAVALAKSLRGLLAAEGVDVRHTEAQSILAAMLGYESWAELRLVTERKASLPSAFDDAGAPGAAEARILRQVERLGIHAGLDGTRARPLVEALGACAPPSARWKAPTTQAAPVPDGRLRGPAMGPAEWLARHGIATWPGIALPEAPVLAALSRQLSLPWPGVDALPPHAKVLAVAFGLYAMGRPRRGRDLLFAQDAAECSHGPSTDEEVARLLADPRLRETIASVTGAHAYVETALSELLSKARKTGGVLGSAEFFWLKGVDRPLWFALGNVGRRAFHVEGVGVTAHLQAERAAGRPLGSRTLERALAGIRRHLDPTLAAVDDDAIPLKEPIPFRLRTDLFAARA